MLFHFDTLWAMKHAISAMVVALLLVGCATPYTGANYRPMVDLREGQGENYERDLADCQAYAASRPGAGAGAAGGAIAGALIGVVFGAIVGGGIRNEMAGIGAVSGGLQGAAAGEGSQRNIIRRCMAGRGYSVLD